jgi:sec-independent protein translocase protein TatB
MNILGIGPGELILIMIILLVVVGPERLPVLARQGGQMLVRVRNWVQKSPDAAMIMRARQEIEQELASLRSSLLEVQNARDEVMQVAKQVNQTITEDFGGAVKDITRTINDESRKIMQGTTDATKAATTATQAAENAASAADVAIDAAHAADTHLNGVAPSTTEANATPALDASNGQTVARGRTRSESFASKPAADAEPSGSAAPQPSDSLALVELRMLHEQMQTMLRDMQALQHSLRGRGLLGDDWQAPATPSETNHDHEDNEATEVTTLAGIDSEERPQ